MRKLGLFAIIVLAIGITAFHSCKKDEELTNNNETKALTSTFNPNEIENMDEYLMGFMKELKNATRDSEPMTIEDAEWHLSACLNFMHCNTNVARTQIEYDTILSTINVNNGYISLNDINASLQEISDKVKEIYNASDLENKNLMYIYPVIEDGATRSSATIRTIVGTSGWGDEYYYFIGGISHPEWWELYEIFTESYYHWETEAPDTLEYHINRYIPDASSSSERIYFTSIEVINFSYEDYPGRIFYCDNCTFNHIFYPDEMMFYLDSFLGIIEENTEHWIYSKLACEIIPVRGYDTPHAHMVPIFYILRVTYGIPTSTNIGTN